LIELKLLGQEIKLPANETSAIVLVAIVCVTLALSLHIALVQAKAENLRELQDFGSKPTQVAKAPTTKL